MKSRLPTWVTAILITFSSLIILTAAALHHGTEMALFLDSLDTSAPIKKGNPAQFETLINEFSQSMNPYANDIQMYADATLPFSSTGEIRLVDDGNRILASGQYHYDPETGQCRFTSLSYWGSDAVFSSPACFLFSTNRNEIQIQFDNFDYALTLNTGTLFHFSSLQYSAPNFPLLLAETFHTLSTYYDPNILTIQDAGLWNASRLGFIIEGDEYAALHADFSRIFETCGLFDNLSPSHIDSFNTCTNMRFMVYSGINEKFQCAQCVFRNDQNAEVCSFWLNTSNDLHVPTVLYSSICFWNTVSSDRTRTDFFIKGSYKGLDGSCSPYLSVKSYWASPGASDFSHIDYAENPFSPKDADIRYRLTFPTENQSDNQNDRYIMHVYTTIEQNSIYTFNDFFVARGSQLFNALEKYHKILNPYNESDGFLLRLHTVSERKPVAFPTENIRTDLPIITITDLKNNTPAAQSFIAQLYEAYPEFSELFFDFLTKLSANTP